MRKVEHRRVRSSCFFARSLCRHALEYVQRPTGSCKMRRKFFFSPPLGKNLNIIGKLKACHWSLRVSLLETGSPRPLKKLAQLFFVLPPLGQNLNISEILKACHWSLRVSLLETDRQSEAVNFFWRCHPLLLVTGVSVIPNIHSLTRYCEWYSWGRERI